MQGGIPRTMLSHNMSAVLQIRHLVGFSLQGSGLIPCTIMSQEIWPIRFRIVVIIFKNLQCKDDEIYRLVSVAEGTF